MGSIGAASMEFCFDVFKELKVHHANENIFYCPIAIMSALAMVYLGAKDSTRTQINKVVRFDKLPGFGDSIEAQCGTSVNVHSSLRDILNQITKPNDVYSFSLASRLYAEERYPILPEYLQCVKELYRGGLEPINFQTAADQARELINSWVESQTNGIIRNVLQPSSVDSQTAMVLVNAIVFKGLWEKAFKDEDTQAMPFRVTEQESKPVQMMYQIGLFRVASMASEKMKILELPFASGTMSMLVLLPDEVSGLEQLESIINFEKLTEWTSSNVMEERKIKVYLPRMKMEEKYNLTSVLMAMGITDVFSSSANLSGISSAESLKISQAVHAAHAEINEAGREVVGSAEAGVDAASVSEEFRADHPFLFCIKHIATNAVLFFGRCVSQLTKKYYSAEPQSVDFVGAANAIRREINSTVEHQTEGKIKSLLPPGSIDSLTRLVLVNALYFKGNWATKFDAEDTRQRPFRINTHTTKPVPIMHLSDKFNWTYIESAQIDVLELPYVNNELSMFILLPRDITGLQKLINELTFEKLSAWTSPELMEKMKMEVYLPRFTVEEKYDLKSTLSKMGIEDAFTEGQADFRGMSENADLFLSQVFHKCYVEVNEEGTEAAAASSASLASRTLGATVIFVADHPFLFIIRHNKTKCILFLGRFCSP